MSVSLTEFTAKDTHDVNNLSQFWEVNPRTIERLAQQGKIPAFKVGHTWRFSTAKILAYMGIEA